MLQDFDNAYQGNAPTVSLKIGNIDVTPQCFDYGTLAIPSDHPVVGQYEFGEWNFVMTSPGDAFNPEASANFFTRNSLEKTGVGVDVEIIAAYTDTTVPLFKGKIENIRFIAATDDQTEGSARIRAVDFSRELDRAVIDFGIEKRFRITSETELEDGHGDYPILPAVLPSSNESETLHLSLSETGDRQETLRNEGNLDSDNFIVDNQGVKTEGGKVTENTSYPQLAMKAPYRSEYATALLKALVNKFGITMLSQEIFPATLDMHFSHYGRPGYDTLGSYGAEYDRTLSWEGIVTDRAIVGNQQFSLKTINSNDTYNRSRLLSYSYSDYTERVAFSFPIGQQAWKMALTSATSGYFMVRDTTDDRKSFDTLTARSTTSVRLVHVDWSGNTPTFTTIASRTSTYRPSGGICFLQLDYGENQGFGYLPDSRTGLLYHNGSVIFTYTSGTGTAGVARYVESSRAFSSLLSFTSDGFENAHGIAISLAGNVLSVSGTFRGSVDSVNWTRDITL